MGTVAGRKKKNCCRYFFACAATRPKKKKKNHGQAKPLWCDRYREVLFFGVGRDVGVLLASLLHVVSRFSLHRAKFRLNGKITLDSWCPVKKQYPGDSTNEKTKQNAVISCPTMSNSFCAEPHTPSRPPSMVSKHASHRCTKTLAKKKVRRHTHTKCCMYSTRARNQPTNTFHARLPGKTHRYFLKAVIKNDKKYI